MLLVIIKKLNSEINYPQKNNLENLKRDKRQRGAVVWATAATTGIAYYVKKVL
ncbi:hypothetical protein [Spiroplasma endosymbiont of Polydrusus formosus]|uniref:hypothetical protein n=1 Tax=Spiroplasma endosymbiont of Polydrusus formosus TaxID=3139326 RepID=UPI0035B5630C